MKFISALSVTLLVCSIAGAQSGLPKKKVESKEVAPTTSTEAATETKSSGSGFKFKFDDDKSGSSRPSVNFHVPNSEEEKNRITADPVNEMFNDAPYKIALGFPKWDFSFSFNPTSYAFTQKLASGFSPNMSAMSTSAFSFNTRLNVDLTNFWEFEYGQFDAKSKAQTGTGLSVVETTSIASSIMVRGFYCWIGNMSARRFCLGGEMGQDSTPTLYFATTNTLEMNRATSYVLGPSLIFQYPVSDAFVVHAKAGVLAGVVGQNAALAVKSDMKIISEVGFKGSLSARHGYSALVDYSIRTTKIEGLQGPNTVSWDMTSANMAGKLAYVYTY